MRSYQVINYITGHCTAGVDSISIVNMLPKLTTIFTSILVNVGPYIAAVCHLCAIVLLKLCQHAVYLVQLQTN